MIPHKAFDTVWSTSVHYNIRINFPKSHLIYWRLNCTSFTRCAEPITLKGIKLKQVDPELLCKESDPTGDPMEDQRDSTNTLKPSPIRSKPDAIAACHTYFFPQMRMDCRKQGKAIITVYSENHVLRKSTHVSYATEKLGKIPQKHYVTELVCLCIAFVWQE